MPTFSPCVVPFLPEMKSIIHLGISAHQITLVTVTGPEIGSQPKLLESK